MLNHSHEFFINLIPLQGLYTHARMLSLSKPRHGKEQPNMTFGKYPQTKQREMSAHENTQVHIQSAAQWYRIIYAKHLLAHL